MTALHEGPLAGLEHDHDALPPSTGEISRLQAFAAVGRLTAHLTALDRAVYPTAIRRLDDGEARVGAARRLARRMTVALRRLDRHLTGDWLLARVPLDRLWDAVVEAGAEHARVEHQILVELDDLLDADEADDLARRYHRSLLAAPSRPHPHAPTHGLAGRPALWFAALADRVRDTLDGRPPSVARPTDPVPPPGLWAAYFLGTARNLRTLRDE